jgi:hypothetical protein
VGGRPGTAILIIHDQESRLNGFEEGGCPAYAGFIIHDRETRFNWRRRRRIYYTDAVPQLELLVYYI